MINPGQHPILLCVRYWSPDLRPLPPCKMQLRFKVLFNSQALRQISLTIASFLASFKPGPFDEPPISVTTLRPSALDRIEELLLQGDRRQAYQFAADEQLWAHAMIIASSIDKEAWKEVINEFLRSELGTKEDIGSESFTSLGNQPQRGRESLRVAYSLFSGQGALSGICSFVSNYSPQ
jgi:Sec23-binding domain of Sec16